MNFAGNEKNEKRKILAKKREAGKRNKMSQRRGWI
jgi:hypothetical protein